MQLRSMVRAVCVGYVCISIAACSSNGSSLNVNRQSSAKRAVDSKTDQLITGTQRSAGTEKSDRVTPQPQPKPKIKASAPVGDQPQPKPKSQASARTGKFSHLCKLPKNFLLSRPEVLPPRLAKFVGAYDGQWSNKQPVTLIVASVAQDGTATVYYAWGNPMDNSFKQGCEKMKGVIEGDILKFTTGGGGRYEYRFNGNRLLGTYNASKNPVLELVRV